MSNSFITANNIVEEALPILADTMQLPALMWQDPSDAYGSYGDIVQVKKPATFSAVEFDGDLDGEYQNISESAINVQLDKIASVDVKITSKEKSMNIQDFMQQVGLPAMTALSEKVNQDGFKLALDIPYFTGTAGVTPDALEDIANTRKILNNHKVPFSPRHLIFNPDAGAEFAVLDALVGADKSGSTTGLREASFGRVHNFNLYESPSVYSHTPGAYTALEDVTVTATAGDTTITLESAAGASTALVKKGDRLTIDGNQYVVTADSVAAIAGDVDVVVYPAIKADATAEAVTFQTAVSALNMGFHPYAFTFVSRPLAPASGGAQSQSLSFNGLNLRVTFGYDMDKKTEIVSFDMLYGFKTLYPELAAIMIG